MLRRGEIYLANLNPSKGAEPAKVRPVLVYQTDMLCAIEHPTTIILPLSTVLIDKAFPLRFRISKREKLDKESDVLIDQLRAVDNMRIILEHIATLTDDEMKAIDGQVQIVLGMKIL